MLDRECALAKLASIYFDAFVRSIVRVFVANVNAEVFENVNGQMVNLVGELVDFLAPLAGLVVIRELAPDHLTREFCAYQCEVTPERILSIINDHQVSEIDLLADSDSRSLPNADDLDPLSLLALSELLDRLRAQELESPDGFVGLMDDGKSMRKTRRRRLSISSDVGLLSPELKSDSKKSPKLLPIIPCPVEIHINSTSNVSGLLHKPQSSHVASLDLSPIISQKQSQIRQIHQYQNYLLFLIKAIRLTLLKIEEYSQSCREYELLSLIYKVISQPDDAILRKLAALEDYEDRLRKLGTKLRSSLSPEDLLRTLASIQGYTN